MQHSVRSAHWATPINPQIAGLSGLRIPEKQPCCGCIKALSICFSLFTEGSQRSASHGVMWRCRPSVLCLFPPGGPRSAVRPPPCPVPEEEDPSCSCSKFRPNPAERTCANCNSQHFLIPYSELKKLQMSPHGLGVILD